MSVAISDVTTLLNTYIGDTSTDRISAAERYSLVTEATSWLLEELGNEHMLSTYDLDFVDGVYYYKVTTGLADLLVGADLRRSVTDQKESFTRKSPRELAEEIGSHSGEDAWGIERRDGDSYLVVNHRSKFVSYQIDTFDQDTDWTADTTGSDALNVTIDSNEYLQGSASLNFDVDVSQSVNNYSTVYRNDYELDLGDLEDLGKFVMDVYIPTVTYTSSMTLYMATGSSLTPSTKANYWSATITTDINGNAFVAGWNKVAINWEDMALTGTPDAEDINYFEWRVTYTASQLDDTDYRFDNFYVARPEKLTFHYVSWDTGTTSAGVPLSKFTADSDIPFYSARYDQYKYVVAHKAASIAFYSVLRLPENGAVEESEAIKALNRYRKLFESSKVKEEKSFKVRGNRLSRWGTTTRRYRGF